MVAIKSTEFQKMSAIPKTKLQKNIRAIIKSMPSHQQQRFNKKIEAFFINPLAEEEFLKEIGKNIDEEYAAKDSKSNSKNIKILFNLKEKNDYLIMAAEKEVGIYDEKNWLLYQI